MRLRSFVTGLLTGLLLLWGGEYVVNHTTFADWLVGPLLRPDTAGAADVIVVPGAGVVGECVANVNGMRRVVRAVRAQRAGRAPAILITGGASDAGCPIAVAMAGFAEEMGVPHSQIYLEPSSRSTRENAERSVPLLEAIGARRLLLVTDQLHMRRAEDVFAHYGFAIERESVPIYESHVDNVDMLRAGIREGLALSYYQMRGWLAASATPRSAGGVVRPVADAERSSARADSSGPVVVFGASYAAGWRLERIAGQTVVNKGVGGDETSVMLGRFQRDVIDAKPRTVIVWGFINDIFRAQAEMPDVTARIRDHYTRMIAEARTAGIEPILATEVTMRPRFESWRDTIGEWAGWLRGKTSYQDRINLEVMAVNRWLKETGAREGLLVLDFQAALAGPDGRRHKLFSQPDGSHITSVGYDVLTAYATPLFEEHFRAR